jgi:hypothetical protein
MEDADQQEKTNELRGLVIFEKSLPLQKVDSDRRSFWSEWKHALLLNIKTGTSVRCERLPPSCLVLQ